jgi:phytoene/squalene synthetase
MKKLFDDISSKCSKLTTRSYSTSFSLGIHFLDKRFHEPIYAIYGFVRFADEIVDSFHGFDKQRLLEKFKKDTYEALEDKISLNPILNSFQSSVNTYGIDKELIDIFLKSMAMDLERKEYNENAFQEYILGSAEVVGLMCLRVFTEGNKDLYNELKGSAMKLGSAFQKVNFLRDMKADFEGLGRSYFPNLNLSAFSSEDKITIEEEITQDFCDALAGIKKLPAGARQGVYLAYVYYKSLFLKIKQVPAEKVMEGRIRISDSLKIGLMLQSVFRHKINAL